MKTTIVTTTIHIPVLLNDYTANAKKYGHKDLDFIVVGDKKTPPEIDDFCKNLAEKSGYPIEYMDVPDQEKYLEKYPELDEHLVYNSIQRRNVGILKAYQQGAEIIITIDDDNFVGESDFVGEHTVLGKVTKFKSVKSSSGWFNVCSLLKEESGQPFYHRGYPMLPRWKKDEEVNWGEKEVRAIVNAGFWKETPDADAITHLFKPLNVLDYEKEENFVLKEGTWSPFNSQNTAIHREAIPAYFLSPHVGRFDDIWASYIIIAIAHHLGDTVSYGHPLVTQKRNPHDYFVDVEKERLGITFSDKFCDWLRAIQFKGKDYQECFGELINHLQASLDLDKKDLSEEEQSALQKFIDGLVVWQKTIERI